MENGATSTGPELADLQVPLPETAVPAAAALQAARDHLLDIRHADGHWCAELEGDTILESEYILTMHFLGRTAEAKVRKAAEYLRQLQGEDGGWAIYTGGPPEISASVKAYFVLKLLGDAPDAPHMARAREAILRMGGIEACNTFTKIYLAIFGRYPWRRCPAVPPEMMFLPRWFYLNIYEMSSWSRAIVVPLSIIWAHKPRCPVPDHATIDELWSDRLPQASSVERVTGGRTVWTMFFTALDRWLKLAEHIPGKPTRKRALLRAEKWILERLEKSDGLGAIFPPIVNTIIALRCLGYPMDHPVLAGQIRELERLEIEEEDTLRVQPCFSPVWDTGLALNSLMTAGVPGTDSKLRAAASWLLDREVRHPGDWQHKVRGAEPAGWYFEYANEFYPDCDDTGEVLTALSRVTFDRETEEQRRAAAMRRGLAWLLAMQNRDGGWAAFDKGCDKKILTYVPFADHNAMIDPSCEDITGRVLETLHALGFGPDHPAVRRAIAWLWSRQEPDGTWYGRWGCNYIYGTWLVLSGLAHHGLDRSDPRVLRARDWLHARQNADGGWGEVPRSYDEPSMKGQGPSTAAQTAWALMALFAAGDYESPAVERGIEHLIRTQRRDGSWKDEGWTGTGFPRVFYLRYHYYALYFPIRALALYQRRHALSPA